MKTYAKRYLPILLIPGLVGFVCFYVVPMAMSVYWSFTDILGGHGFVWLDNYKGLADSGVFALALRNTLLFTLLSLVSLTAFAFALAYMMAFTHLRRFLPPLLVALPFAVPAVAVASVWNWIISYKGYVSFVAHMLFGTEHLNLTGGAGVYVAILLLFIWKYAGFCAVIYLPGFTGLPAEYIDTFRIESTSKLRFIRYVLWPYVFPQTFFVLIVGFIGSFGIFREIYAVWKDYPPRSLYMISHYINNNFAKLEYESSIAAANVLMLIVVVFVALLVAVEKRYSGDRYG